MMQISNPFNSWQPIVILAIIFTSACGAPRLSEGKLGCESDEDCPDGWVCDEAGDQRCYSSKDKFSVPEDAGDGQGSDTRDDTMGPIDTETDLDTDTPTQNKPDEDAGADGGGDPEVGSDTETETETGPDPCQIQARVYDFEEELNQFKASALDGTKQVSWEWGTPTLPEGRECHSGESCYVTRLDNNYDDCTSAELVSPAIDLSSCSDSPRTVVFRFWHYYDFSVDPGDDGGALLFSGDNGKTWHHVAPIDFDPIGGAYDGKKCKNTIPELHGQPGWSGLVPGSTWTEVSVEVDAAFKTAAFKFRFLFSSDRNGNAEGWLIDDVEIAVE